MRYNKKIGQFYLFDIISFVCRLGLGIIFLLAALSKIPEMTLFQQNVASYHMLPISLLHPFAFTLPWIELIVGIYLILGVFAKQTAMLSILLLLIFMTAITYAIITKQPVSGCGCFSQSAGTPVGWIDDIRDIGFLILAVGIILTDTRFLSIDTFLHKRSEGDKNKGATA